MPTVTTEDNESSEPKIGSRVRVTSADGSSELGYGTYMGEVPLSEIPDKPSADDSANPSSDADPEIDSLASTIADQMLADGTTPKIVLDSGETVYGYECWWEVLTVQSEQSTH